MDRETAPAEQGRVGEVVQEDVSLHRRRDHGRIPDERRVLAGRTPCQVPGVRAHREEEAEVDGHEMDGRGLGEAAQMSEPLFRVKALRKVYRSGASDLVLFDGLSFEVRAGEMLAIVGESGSGKSTLLHMLGALDLPTSGEIFFGETAVHRIAREDEAASEFRTRQVGYVWQFHYLLPEFSALENIAMPLLAAGETQESALGKAKEWLKQVNLEERGHHRPGELSGGEQQRVAIARALVTKPRALLADEPT